MIADYVKILNLVILCSTVIWLFLSLSQPFSVAAALLLIFIYYAIFVLCVNIFLYCIFVSRTFGTWRGEALRFTEHLSPSAATFNCVRSHCYILPLTCALLIILPSSDTLSCCYCTRKQHNDYHSGWCVVAGALSDCLLSLSLSLSLIRYCSINSVWTKNCRLILDIRRVKVSRCPQVRRYWVS